MDDGHGSQKRINYWRYANEKKNEILEKDIKPVDDFSSTTNVKQDHSKIQDKSTNFKDSKTPIKNEQTKKD